LQGFPWDGKFILADLLALRLEALPAVIFIRRPSGGLASLWLV